jgi:hypothetical protein
MTADIFDFVMGALLIFGLLLPVAIVVLLVLLVLKLLKPRETCCKCGQEFRRAFSWHRKGVCPSCRVPGRAGSRAHTLWGGCLINILVFGAAGWYVTTFDVPGVAAYPAVCRERADYFPSTFRSVLAHEWTHHALRAVASGALPPWLDEGCAGLVASRAFPRDSEPGYLRRVVSVASERGELFSGEELLDVNAHQLSWRLGDWSRLESRNATRNQGS